MAQNLFAALTAPSLVSLDANFTEVYGFCKNIVSDNSGNITVGGNILLNGATPTITFNTGGPTLAVVASNTLACSTSGVERWRVDSSGNLNVGVSGLSYHAIGKSAASSYALGVNNSSSTSPYCLLLQLTGVTNTGAAFLVCADAGASRLNILGNGNVANVNNSYGAISDAKLKENVVDAQPLLDRLLQVRIRNYNLIADPGRKQIGVVAQELEQVFPGLVEEMPDHVDGEATGTVTKSVKYSVFVPMLVKALQEQQVLIQALQARVEILEARA